MPAKTPQDHKAKDEGFTFPAAGKKHRLPAITEEAASSIPGGITMDAVLHPDDTTVQMRLAFALLEATKPAPTALAALRSLGTTEMLEVVSAWMGKSGGSSDSSPSTEEPSSTTSEAASA